MEAVSISADFLLPVTELWTAGINRHDISLWGAQRRPEAFQTRAERSLIFTLGNKSGNHELSKSSFAWNNWTGWNTAAASLLNEYSLTPRNLGFPTPVWEGRGPAEILPGPGWARRLTTKPEGASGETVADDKAALFKKKFNLEGRSALYKLHCNLSQCETFYKFFIKIFGAVMGVVMGDVLVWGGKGSVVCWD